MNQLMKAITQFDALSGIEFAAYCGDKLIRFRVFEANVIASAGNFGLT